MEDQVEEILKDPIVKKAVDWVRKSPIFKRDLMGVEENALQVFDLAKRRIDDQIGIAQRAGRKNEARILKKAKDDLLGTLDATSPDYKQARSIFSEESLIPEEISKTKVGEIAKLEGDKVEKAAGKILSPLSSSPEITAIAKEAIIKNGGEDAWNALLRIHLKDRFEKIVGSNTQNLGGRLYKDFFLNGQQRKILQEAMTPEQFETFTEFMRVLQAAGKTAGKESTTAPRLVSIGQLEEEGTGLGGKITRAIAYPLFTWKRIVADFRLNMKKEKYMNLLADAMIDPANSIKFRKMLQLKPGSQQQIKQLSTFLTSLGGGGYMREKKRQNRRGS